LVWNRPLIEGAVAFTIENVDVTAPFLFDRKFRNFLSNKNAPRDAHSRDWKISQATALGARVSQAKLFVPQNVDL